MEGTIGEIRMFAGNFAPRDWEFCNGQLIAISQNQALFSVIGTIYGGDGRTTFGLPDLRGRMPVGAGQGPGLSGRRLGEKEGTENVTLNVSQIPSHNHKATATPNLTANIQANSANATTGAPGNNYLAQSIYPTGRGASDPVNTYSDSSDGTKINGGTVDGSIDVNVENTGNSQAHNNMQPFLGMNFIICVNGLYPERQ
ncbi:MAG TPA: tail fiber protein [Balneolales bacterium]|nr:tail fiber protein [Balneolales bacterium]